MIPDSVFEFVHGELEGGDTLHDRGADDPGRLTRWGFSQVYNPDLNIATLTRARAVVEADKRYWRPAMCYEFHPGLALMHYDTAVNQGVGTAARVLQQAAGVRVDGKIGLITIRTANEWDQMALLERYAMIRKERWLQRDDHVEEANENGWINRLIRVLMRSVRLEVERGGA